MYQFGLRSLSRLKTCHADLQRVANRAIGITPIDITIIWGFRNEAQQEEAYRAGNSKLRWPDSKHNHRDVLGDPCSLAIDIAPWVAPGFIPWGDGMIHGHTPAQQLRYWDICAGAFLAAAALENVGIRWGGDWDRDAIIADNRFNDLGHFELTSN